MTQRMLPSSSAKNIVVNGRTYNATAGVTVDVPDQDAAVMSANGWLNSAGGTSSGTGTTAQRPVNPRPGTTYHDVTLGYVIVHDGGNWRHQSTGAVV